MYRKPEFIISHESLIPISFHDTDAMRIVWHGNYIKYFELAREDMFNAFDFGYDMMKKHIFAMPIVECECKYRNPLKVTDKCARVISMMTQCEGKIEIHYEVYALNSDILCAYGHTAQVMINARTNELLYITPQPLLDAIEDFRVKKENV